MLYNTVPSQPRGHSLSVTQMRGNNLVNTKHGRRVYDSFDDPCEINLMNVSIMYTIIALQPLNVDPDAYIMRY